MTIAEFCYPESAVRLFLISTRPSGRTGPYHDHRISASCLRRLPSMRGKQMLMTAFIALAVVVGVKVYEAKKG